MRTYWTNDGERLTAAQLVDREVRMPDPAAPGSWTHTGIIVGETHGGRLVVRWDGSHRTNELHDVRNIVIFGRRDDRVMELLECLAYEHPRELSEERAELHAVAAEVARAVDTMRSAVRAANEAAGWMSSEAARLRR